MIQKPFRTPLLRKPEESTDNDGFSVPQAKKRRISNDKGDGGPRLVFKTPGISSLPRKPLLAVKNPAVATESPSGGFERYYNVLWYVDLLDERSDD